MPSALQSVLTSLQQNDYVTLIILTAVGYDYILTSSDEIEYIWSNPWTWVSTLFIIVRYLGLFTLIFFSLWGSSFVPGPAKTCAMMNIVAQWIFVLFLGAADFVMILRVWAMYSRSKLILRTLLAMFSLEIIFTVLAVAIYSNPRNQPGATIQIFHFSFCALQPTLPIWSEVAKIWQITLGAAMCILAIVQFVRQSLQLYRVTGQWQFNRYMSLLVKQGILYFFAIFLLAVLNELDLSGKLPASGWLLGLLATLEYVPLYTLTPRFIPSIRELYARDVQGRRGEEIDTGFGLSLSSRGAGGTAIVFADVEQDEELGDVEEIPMKQEVGTTHPD